MDAFNSDLTPEEIKMATIAFMGQHLTGELKQLNSNIISQNPTLRGNTLNPVQIVNTIPSKSSHNPRHTAVNAGINTVPPQQPSPVNHVRVHEQPAPVKIINESSTELKEIISILKRIEDKLDKIRIP